MNQGPFIDFPKEDEPDKPAPKTGQQPAADASAEPAQEPRAEEEPTPVLRAGGHQVGLGLEIEP
ncbi:hypothetical protein [Streptomyces xanthochromogenes]|uniref:hypothetical protein n=1 Tax=Streptomyces xanthochromogenes TaxID=67384 RepID=UPI003811E777